MTERAWPLWEVFVRPKRGLSHLHAGSLHAPDAEMALRNARDLYTRRQEGVSIWVVPAAEITASSPDERDAFFDPAADKVYRHPTFYDVPADVEYLLTGTLVRADTLPPAARYCLRVADDSLVMAQRLGEWLAAAPQIEEDMALGNIALDLLGQARALLTRAGELSAEAGGPAYTEDDLAYWRDERSFANVQLVEQERGDFAVTMVRLLVLASWQGELYAALSTSSDPVIAAVAAKASHEVAYHHDHARQWVLRLGLGTAVSRARSEDALAAVGPYVAELFDDDELVETLAEQGIAVLPSRLRPAVEASIDGVLREADLEWPEVGWRARGGRDGRHSTAMGHLLAEMQHLARSHPGAVW